jgi:hypothetical protein
MAAITGLSECTVIQAHPSHANDDTTVNQYMQEAPESVQAMVGSAYLMLANEEQEQQSAVDLPRTSQSILWSRLQAHRALSF